MSHYVGLFSGNFRTIPPITGEECGFNSDYDSLQARLYLPKDLQALDSNYLTSKRLSKYAGRSLIPSKVSVILYYSLISHFFNQTCIAEHRRYT